MSIISLFLSVLLAITGTYTSASVTDTEFVVIEDADYTVGVLQLIEHPALDAVTQGFTDTLVQKMTDAGKKVDIQVQTADGELANCSTIANTFVSSGVDLIMANATPALQAAVAATADIPILGTSVTDYATALDIRNWTGTVGGNISGTSDLAPLSEQAKMIVELFPDATNVGLLYCSAEPNSYYQAELIKEELKKLNPDIICTDYKFSDSNEIYTVTEVAAHNSEVIYIPTDNTVAANASIVGTICYDAMVPVVTADEHTCSACGVACLSIDYYNLGVKTGEMAAKILLEGADISKMPIEYAPDPTKKYNPEICSALNVIIPEDYLPIY